jgi:DNA helicase HerA-like ATPase
VFCPFGLREDEWIKHVLVTGMTGAGKTNLIFQIVRELRRHEKPFLVFDWKRNYRDLRQLPGLADCTVFTIGSDVSPFFFNPLLPPPQTRPGEWLMKLVDVLKHAYFVGAGVEHLLREAMDWTYEQCGMLSGEMREVPTFQLVRNYVARKQLFGRMSLWKASAQRVLESLCFRHGLGPVVNVSRQWDYEALLKRPVVMELDSLSDVDKVFFTEAMILWLYELRKREGKREQFKHALIIEEGHHVLSQKKELHEGAETIMETCLRQIREFGEAVVVVDQEPTKLSNSIKANTYTKISFNLGNGKDVLEISNCMGLSKEESSYIDLLQVGQGIVTLKGRTMVPLLVAFPRIAVEKGAVTDVHLTKPNNRSNF